VLVLPSHPHTPRRTRIAPGRTRKIPIGTTQIGASSPAPTEPPPLFDNNRPLWAHSTSPAP
jgi:hypothetical protein